MDGPRVRSLQFHSHAEATVRFELVRREFMRDSVFFRAEDPLYKQRVLRVRDFHIGRSVLLPRFLDRRRLVPKWGATPHYATETSTFASGANGPEREWRDSQAGRTRAKNTSGPTQRARSPAAKSARPSPCTPTPQITGPLPLLCGRPRCTGWGISAEHFGVETLCFVAGGGGGGESFRILCELGGRSDWLARVTSQRG